MWIRLPTGISVGHYADGLRRLYSLLFPDATNLVWVKDSEEFSEACKSMNPDLIILDIDLENSEIDGLEILQTSRERLKGSTICVHSNRADSSTVSEALAAGADFVFPKPMTVSHFAKLTEQVRKKGAVRSEREGEG